MASIKKIKEIYNQELDYLNNALKNSNNQYHTFSLSTIKNSYPEARTVVLRNIKQNPSKLYFNSDIRSPKIQELELNNNCTALFYNNIRKIQLRFKCKAIIHNQNSLCANVWKQTHLQSRKCYMAPYSPSIVLKKWEPNLPIKYLKSDPSQIDSELGYKNFSHIELQVLETEILQLHHDGHIRFKKKDSQFIFISS